MGEKEVPTDGKPLKPRFQGLIGARLLPKTKPIKAPLRNLAGYYKKYKQKICSQTAKNSKTFSPSQLDTRLQHKHLPCFLTTQHSSVPYWVPVDTGRAEE